MAAKDPGAFSEITTVPPATDGQNPPGFEHVKDYLLRFGYLPVGEYEDRALDATVSEGLAKFQQFFSISISGRFDEATRDVMTMSRCGMADLTAGAAFATACRWARTSLTFVLDTGTADTAGQSEWSAIRAAFNTWQTLGIFTFQEVKLNQAPDIFVDFRPADDPDLSMVGGILAHADFPPGCSVVTTDLPKPIHFDDSEHTWSIGSASGSFDVESVALHEIGHIVGLAHSSTPGAVMQPTISPNSTLRALTQDDIDGFNSLYAKVPDVIGLRRLPARQAVLAARLVPKFIGPPGPREVVDQSPAAESVVTPGSTVTMTVEPLE